LQKFAQFCFSKVAGGQTSRILSDAYRLVLFEEAINNADLKFYKSINEKVGINVIERLANVVYGIKEDGIKLHNLFIELAEYNPENTEIRDFNKLNDIAEIFAEYQKLLGDKFLDYPELLNKITNLLSYINQSNPFDIKNKIFDGKTPKILIYGFSEFKKPEIEFFSTFGGTDIPFIINLDFSPKNGPLFGNLQETYEWLLSTKRFKAFSDDEDGTIFQNFPESDLNKPPDFFMRKWLFKKEIKSNYKNLSDVVNIFAFDSVNNEVKAICKLIKQLIRNEGYKSNDICICTRNQSLYSDLFREAFYIEKIPVNISDRFEISESPIITAIFTLFDLLNEDFHRKHLLKILHNPFIDFNPVQIMCNEESSKSGLSNETISHLNIGNEYKVISEKIEPDINNLILIITKSRIYRGNWIKRFEAKLTHLNNIISNEIGSESDVDRNRLNHEKNQLEKAISDLKIIFEKLPTLDYEYLPSEFSKFIKNGLIRNLKIKEKIFKNYISKKLDATNLSELEKNIELEEIEKNSRALIAFLKIVDEMEFVLNDKFPEKKFDKDELISRLRTAVNGGKYQIIEKVHYGVEVTSVEQTRGIPFKISILCGANEGTFPITFHSDSFLGKDLPNSKKRHINSEQVQFYQFLTNGKKYFTSKEKKIFITYSKSSNDLELSISPFINSLLKITNLYENGNVIDFTEDNISKSEKYSWIKKISSRIDIIEYLSQSIKLSENVDSNLLIKQDLKNDFDYLVKYNQIPKMFPIVNLIENDSNDTINSKLSNITKNVFSISNFDEYASCPYKYFVAKVLRLDKIELADKQISPIETGNLIHIVLFRFYQTLADNDKSMNWIQPAKKYFNLPDIKPVRLVPENRNEYLILLLNFAHEEFKNYFQDISLIEIDYKNLLGFEISDSFDSNKIDIINNKGRLAFWLDRELERLSRGWDFQPALFEFGFGLNKNNNYDIREVNFEDKFKLNGKIDRVEFINSDEGISFIIGDYKSRSDRTQFSDKYIEQGNSFQMPLYAHSMKVILKQYYGIEASPVGAVYYGINDKFNEKSEINNHKSVMVSSEFSDKLNNIKRSNKKTGFLETNEIIQNTINYAEEIINKISSGIFDIIPNKTVCQYCEYYPVCRIKTKISIDETEEEKVEEVTS
jgi:ATP-dependent helicase/DNAse subunit B